MNIYITLVLLFAAIVSCKNELNPQLKGSKLEIVDIVEFHIDSLSDFDSKFLFNYKDSLLFKISPRARDNSIYVYNFSDEGLLTKITAPKEPEGVYVLNLDSILVSYYHKNQFQWIDFEGNIGDSIDFNIKYDEVGLFKRAATYWPINFINSTIWFHVSPNTWYTNFYKFPTLASVRINDQNDILKVNTTQYYPEKFKIIKSYQYFWPSSCYKDELIYTSFEVEDEIYVYNFDGLLESHLAKSKYIIEIPDYDTTKGMSQKYSREFMISNPHYGIITYNHNSKLFFRVALHRQDLISGNRANSYHDRSWSLIVFDSSFNFITEKYFEPRKYEFTDIVAFKDGVLISNNHIDNPMFDPDKLSYTYFKLQ